MAADPESMEVAPLDEPLEDPLDAVRGPALAGAIALLFTLGVDLGSKALAVHASPPLRVFFDQRHNGDGLRRTLLALVALNVVWLLSFAASRRGVGRLWGTWVGLGLLVGGIVGNGLSHALWVGTPDFIWAGSYVWNLADFAIGLGLAGGIVSAALAAAHAAWRDRRLR